jgi:PAS domain S-box-containing protein
MTIDTIPAGTMPLIDSKDILRILEQSGKAFFITDHTATILYASPGMEVVTGYSVPELVAQNARLFRSDRNPETLYKDMWTTILSGASWAGILINKKKNGDEYRERLSIVPLSSGRQSPPMFCAWKEEAHEEAAAIASGADPNASPSSSPDEMLHFITRVIEEMRSSLNTSKGFTDLLMEDVEDRLDLVKQDYLSIIRQTHQRMLNTIEDVLTIVRLDVGDVKLQLEPVEIAKEMKRIITGLSVVTVRHNMRVIKVIEDKGALISVDRLGLEQIIMNLVSNALKFTGDGGYLTFGVNVQDNQALITVIDTGIGISEDFKPRVFQPFYQEEIGNRMEYEGAGLGLAITKRLTELMGGTIAFESRKNAGTTFMLLFPIVGWTRE